MNTQSAPPKHTPGPWITDTGKVPKLGNAIGVLKQSHKPGEKGESICIIALEKDAKPHDHGNARLIAAAPDLLESLAELLASVTSERAEDTSLPIAWSGSPAQNHRMHAALKSARAVLANARGHSGQNDPAHATGTNTPKSNDT